MREDDDEMGYIHEYNLATGHDERVSLDIDDSLGPLATEAFGQADKSTNHFYYYEPTTRPDDNDNCVAGN